MRILRKTLYIALACSSLTLTACGSMRHYGKELDGTIENVRSGQIDVALAKLDNDNTSALQNDDKDLLYHLERGSLLRYGNRLDASTTSWLAADGKVNEWESLVRSDMGKYLGQFGSFIVNDKVARYDGKDYEKVLLSTELAINHALRGDWDAARIEIKKAHEREALIEELRAKEREQVEADAQKRGVTASFKELKGYPVETLDDPDVLKLRNGYQNPFSHYLAGFVYEALGENSLAAPGYRKAIELQPNKPRLEGALAGLDGRSRHLKKNESDVLFVIESGEIANRRSVSFPVPAVAKGNLLLVPVSFPTLHAYSNPEVQQVNINGTALALTPISNLDLMAKRTLRDEMPGIILRGVVRATAKSLLQKEMNDRAGALAGLLTAVATNVSESADERGWRSLPAQITIARATLPQGTHRLSVAGSQGQRLETEITIRSHHTIVPVRMLGSSVYLSQGIAPTAEATTLAEDTTPPPVQKKKSTKKRASL